MKCDKPFCMFTHGYLLKVTFSYSLAVVQLFLEVVYGCAVFDSEL